MMEEKLVTWKEEDNDGNQADPDDPDEVTEPPAKMSTTQMLKKRMG